MIALIDGDVIKYSCGFAGQKTIWIDEDGEEFLFKRTAKGMKVISMSTRHSDFHAGVFSTQALKEILGGEFTTRIDPEPEPHVLSTVKRMIQGIMRYTGSDDYHVYLTKGKCFRFGVYSEYKANRMDTPKPYHIDNIERYLLTQHPCTIYEEIEADDALSITQCKFELTAPQSTILCSLDKDLDMVPGLHWNWQDKRLYQISPEAGLRNFWRQTLTGDDTDNIPGLPGIGNATADKILRDVPLAGMRDAVLEQYEAHGQGEQEFQRNATLLWMLRKSLEETYGKSYADFFEVEEE